MHHLAVRVARSNITGTCCANGSLTPSLAWLERPQVAQRKSGGKLLIKVRFVGLNAGQRVIMPRADVIGRRNNENQISYCAGDRGRTFSGAACRRQSSGKLGAIIILAVTFDEFQRRRLETSGS